MFTQSADFSRIELAFSKFEFLEGLTTEDTESTEREKEGEPRIPRMSTDKAAVGANYESGELTTEGQRRATGAPVPSCLFIPNS